MGGVRWLVALIGMLALVMGGSTGTALGAPVLTIGTSLSSGAPNDSVCKFKPEGLLPETRFCAITQGNLDVDLDAPAGLVAPFDGRVVQWSVLAGSRSANTGEITVALRTGKRGGPVYQGPERVLPEAIPGARIDFAEDLPIEEGAQLALRIGIRTGGTQEEVGAPLALVASSIDVTETWLGATGEPWPPGGGLVDVNSHQALLLQAEIESSEDRIAPVVRRQFARRQVLSRVARLWVRSNEDGAVRATGKLRIAGQRGSFAISSKRVALREDRWRLLGLPVRGRAARAVRAAEDENRRVVLIGKGRVSDEAGNVRAFSFRVRGR